MRTAVTINGKYKDRDIAPLYGSEIRRRVQGPENMKSTQLLHYARIGNYCGSKAEIEKKEVSKEFQFKAMLQRCITFNDPPVNLTAFGNLLERK